MTTTNAPQGELVLRTLAMPADTNANGDIFGGWLMSQMDMGGAILAKEIAHGRVVTVRVDGMTFLRPVAVGDVVCCYARCVKRGNTSISINIEVWVKKVSSEPIGQRYKATEALFIYVAVDSEENLVNFRRPDRQAKKPPFGGFFYSICAPPFRRKTIFTISPLPGFPAS
jgi:acyl-CoA thioesterase YciA